MILRSVILLVVPLSVFSQTLHREEAEIFITALLWNKSSLASWFEADNLAMSRRLGIEYEGVENKNLIAYGIDDSTKGVMRDGRLGYSVAVDSLDGKYARLTLTIHNVNGAREFYFKQNRCISPLAYLTRNWTIVESEHFRFFLSDSTLFNPYCREQLELFVARMATLLHLNDRDIQTLRREKIFYYLCRDEDEIQRLTGFRVRGMFNLAYDAVITTFNAHYHELLHLLINFKLRHLPLYTHPFLQEGFAVAYGGRGGLEPEVILPVGSFLYHSQFVELSPLLESEGFRQLEPSLSYPAAGLYNRFLVESIGIESYLRLYRAYSGSKGNQATPRIPFAQLPEESKWNSYLQTVAARNPVTLDTMPLHAHIITKDSTLRIAEESGKYYFLLSDVVLLPGRQVFPYYKSKAFQEILPGGTYRGEEYLIRATSGEISVYNLFTNNLIASYAVSFSIRSKSVPRFGGRYCFSISKRIFDEPIRAFPGVSGIDGH